MFKATTRVQAQKAAKYINTLGKHFAKKVPVLNEGEHVTVSFDMGTCYMELDDLFINFLCEAEESAGLETVKMIITSHINMLGELRDTQVEWHEESA